jgi:hypothetical protein
VQEPQRPEEPPGQVAREAPEVRQAAPEVEEVVEGLFDRVAHQVQHHVMDVLERAGRPGPRRAAGVVRHPALPMDDPRQLVLLGHVVELVPGQVRPVAGVVLGPARARQREEPDLDAVHTASRRVPAHLASASSCSR